MTTSKVFASIIALGLGLGSLFSQSEGKKVEISLRVAPTLSMPSAKGESNFWDFEKGSPQLKFNGGLSADIFLQDNVALSTGIWYTGKRSSFTVESQWLNASDNKEVLSYNLNYLEVPLLFKGLTNNLNEKMRIYVNLGGVFGFKLSESFAGSDDDRPLQTYPDGEYLDQKYAGFFDASLLMGGGIELNIGTSNKVYLGGDYSLGLTNIIHKDFIGSLSQDPNATPISKGTNYSVRNSYVAFVAGFKF